MAQKFSDAARAELVATINSTDLSFTIAAGGSLFPVADTGASAIGNAADWFKIVLQDVDGIEIVYVRTHVADSLSFSNILRGQEGTTAKAFLAGSIVGLRPLASDAANVIRLGDARDTAITLALAADPSWLQLADMPAVIAAGADAATARTAIGLGSVDNTSDAGKPVSTAQQTALNLKANLASPALTGTPTAPTASAGTNTTQVATTAYVNAEIAADAAPLSHVGTGGTEHANASTSVAGFLSAADKTKLDGVADGANAYSHPANHPASIITQDSSNRFVTDAEKTAWSAKQDSDEDLTAIAALAGTAGLLKKTSANTWSLDTTAYTTNVGDVTLVGAETLTNKTLTRYTETVYNLTGTDIAVANGTIQTKTLAANTTFTESLADGQSVILGITAGAYSVTWPSVTWSKVGGSGVAPTLTSSGVNWIILWQVGGVVRGSFMGTA